MDCMKQKLVAIGSWGAVICGLLLAVAACSKGEADLANPASLRYDFYGSPGQEAGQAVGTVRSREGMRFIQLDALTAGFVVNPDEIRDIEDGTRVYLQFRTVLSSATPDFCTDAILVEWATPLDTGGVSLLNFEETFSADSFLATDPVEIVPDWITSLEDGFLTLHYVIAAGDRKHSFGLYRGMGTTRDYYLVHDGNGDPGKQRVEGIVCFPLQAANRFPEGESGTFTLTYLNFDLTLQTLTFEYRSPK